jgi:hypothetical protein
MACLSSHVTSCHLSSWIEGLGQRIVVYFDTHCRGAPRTNPASESLLLISGFLLRKLDIFMMGVVNFYNIMRLNLAVSVVVLCLKRMC